MSLTATASIVRSTRANRSKSSRAMPKRSAKAQIEGKGIWPVWVAPKPIASGRSADSSCSAFR
jgi:hypothetical protein